MTMKLMIEVEQALTGSTRLKRILFDCCWLVSWATVTGYLERFGITIGRSNVCKLLFPGSTHDCNNACNMSARPALMYVAQCMYIVSSGEYLPS